MTDKERYALKKEKEAQALESVSRWLSENNDPEKRRVKRAQWYRQEEKWIPGRQID